MPRAPGDAEGLSTIGPSTEIERRPDADTILHRDNGHIVEFAKPDIRAKKPSNSRTLELLVIEPRLFTRGCLVAAINGALAQATSVSTIEEGLDLIRAGGNFDAILVNVSSDALEGSTLTDLAEPPDSPGEHIPIIVLTTSLKPTHILSALRQGVSGYVTTDMPVDMMIDAIRLVAAGWAVHPSIELEQHAIVKANVGDGADLASKLTRRQAEVLRYLATGMPNKTIAARLNLSERTVKAHVQEIMQRVGASNRTQIVALLGNASGAGLGDQG